MSNKGVCRTALAQPVLLIKVKVLIQSGCILSSGEVGIESVCATMRLFYICTGPVHFRVTLDTPSSGYPESWTLKILGSDI